MRMRRKRCRGRWRPSILVSYDPAVELSQGVWNYCARVSGDSMGSRQTEGRAGQQMAILQQRRTDAWTQTKTGIMGLGGLE